MTAAESTPSTLVRFSPAPEAPRRLYCFPFAGGGPSAYRRWATYLAPDVEVVAVAMPGRDPGSKVPPPDTIGQLVDATRAAVVEMQGRDRRPFAFFGHSMGALVAYELAVALERSGEGSPTHLFVSGRRAPDQPHPGRPIHGLDDEAFLDAMNASYGGVPDIVRNEPDLLALFLPALRADVHAFETHVPLVDATVACPVHVYGGRDDDHPSPDQLAGWQRVATDDITVRVFPGGHFYFTAAGAETVAEALTGDIAARLATATSEAAP